MSKDTPQEKYYSCLDIESHRPDSFFAIGRLIGDSNGCTIVKKDYWLEYPEGEKADERTKREFLDNQPELMDTWSSKKQPRNEEFAKFVKEYDSDSKSLGISEEKIELISNNPEFDYGMLSGACKEVCGRYPIRCTSEGVYRPISNNTEVSRNLKFRKIVSNLANEIQNHDHIPSNDAENIFISHIICDRIINKINEELGEKIQEIALKVGMQAVSDIKKAREDRKRKVQE